MARTQVRAPLPTQPRSVRSCSTVRRAWYRSKRCTAPPPPLVRVFARSSTVPFSFSRIGTIGARSRTIESVDRVQAVTTLGRDHRRRAPHAPPHPTRPLHQRTRAPFDQHGVTWPETIDPPHITIIVRPHLVPKPQLGSDSNSTMGSDSNSVFGATRARPVYCRGKAS